MTYLLDTNACIRLLNKSHSGLDAKVRSLPPERLAVCSVVKGELLYGARKSRRAAENLRLLEKFFIPFRSYPYDDHCAETTGRIRADLAALGTPIGPSDLLIAATAVTNDLILVSHNVGEFSRVVGLKLEDWETN